MANYSARTITLQHADAAWTQDPDKDLGTGRGLLSRVGLGARTIHVPECDLWGLKIGKDCKNVRAALEEARALEAPGLKLEHQVLTPEDAELLGTLRELRGLSLYATRFRAAGFANLGKLTRLEELDLMDALGVNDESLAALAPLVELKDLALEGAGDLDEGEDDLLDEKRQRLTDAAVPHVVKLRNVRELTIDGHNLTRAGVEGLVAMPKLEKLYVLASNDALKAERASIQRAGLEISWMDD